MSEVEVTAHLDAEIKPDETLVYCATFQLAWNQLCDEVIGQPSLCLAGDPPIAQALNQRLVGADDLDARDYVAMAGFARDGIVERIRHALHEKFDREPMIDLEDPGDILAYAYLEKILRFANVFPEFDGPLRFNDGTLVESFGIYAEDPACEQVTVLDYRDANDFIIRLDATSPQDELILAKAPPLPTLRETIDAVLARTTPEGRQMAARALREAGRDFRQLLKPKLQSGTETLQIPKITLDVQQSYQALIGKSLCNPGWEDYYVSKALQAIKFDLDEAGAILRSEGVIEMMKIAHPYMIVEERRQFIFDGPFLVCLKKREARYPYLALWVGNSRVLVRHEEVV
jgi:hypothetical protein